MTLNIKNRTIFCDDNLDVMRGINSECIDLIYLDPPFNKNKKFTAPIGSSAEGAEFSDIFRQEDVKDEWLVTIKEDQPELYHYLNGIKGVGNSYNFAYLAYMAIRLIECHRILKQTGSIYLHCDPTMSHYLKALMDCVFGEKNFRNEIVWKRTHAAKSGSKSQYQKKLGTINDTIFCYAVSEKFNILIPKYYPDGYEKEFKFSDNKGMYRTHRLVSSAGMHKSPCFEWNGLNPQYGWLYSKKGMNELEAQDRIHWNSRGTPLRKEYIHEYSGRPYANLWTDIPIALGKEKTGYPTQKPVTLLERIIKASSNKNDIVLDPFCGCATTCVAAEKLNRQWVGIDVSFKAYELVKERLTKEAADPEDLYKYQNEIHMRTSPPKRTDQGTDYRERKFVYVISHPNFPGEFKVGIAKNWKDRLNSYQTSDPERQYKLEFKIETPLFRETEKYIHETFPNKHEWVQGELKQITKAIEEYQQ